MVRILHLEDDPLDSEIAWRLLREAGLEFEAQRVHTFTAFQQALEQRHDLILSDYSLPGADPIRALSLARQLAPDTPFIFLSGMLGEEVAIEMLKLGATDYVLKQRLERLVPAVNRALQEAEEQQRRKRAEAELQRHQRELVLANEQLERKVQERTAELRDSLAQMESFTYSLSHDLRAPLRTIQAFTQLVLLKSGDRLGAPGQELLPKVLNAARRMDRLIQDLLEFTRLSRQEIQLTPVDLQRLVREIIQEIPEFQPPKAVIEIQPPLLPVLGQRAFLTQCITNLLSNAVKFVAADTTPRVHIHSEPHRDQVRLWFVDNGIGIDPSFQGRLFQLFSRLHPTTEYEGTGLGLAIVRKAVERMGGQVGVESEPGQGSRFWIQLPRAP